MRAFAEQPDIHLAQHRPEAVRVFHPSGLVVVPLHLQAINGGGGQTEPAFKKSVSMLLFKPADGVARADIQHLDLPGTG